MLRVKEAVVKAVKKSEVKKGIYYVTVDDGLGEIKVVSRKNYAIGKVLLIKQRTPIDFIFDIVGEKEAK